jgi:hypothetical protein
MSAILSPCGTYRYTLERPLTPAPVGWALWVMLNPSTADAVHNDQTIRRVMDFTRAWGWHGALVGNLFAYRATDPRELWKAKSRGVDIVGPENDEYLNRLANRAEVIICAWGGHAIAAPQRASDVVKFLAGKRDLFHLGLTKAGQPSHPLYKNKAMELQPWAA